MVSAMIDNDRSSAYRFARVKCLQNRLIELVVCQICSSYSESYKPERGNITYMWYGNFWWGHGCTTYMRWAYLLIVVWSRNRSNAESGTSNIFDRWKHNSETRRSLETTITAYDIDFNCKSWWESMTNFTGGCISSDLMGCWLQI